MWLQGSIVDNAELLNLTTGVEKEWIGIVASQSCDIANRNFEQEPVVEILIAKKIPIEKVDGNCTYNKNPRVLHFEIDELIGDSEIVQSNFEVEAASKFSVGKEIFFECTPSTSKYLTAANLSAFPHWLASRYARSAMPDEFNNRIQAADPRRKLRKKAKSLNAELVGIYVEILPDREISESELYEVNLLGLLSSGSDGNDSKAEQGLKEIENIFITAGFKVKAFLKRENDVSVALIKRFKRLYLDDLSVKGGTELPGDYGNS